MAARVHQKALELATRVLKGLRDRTLSRKKRQRVSPIVSSISSEPFVNATSISTPDLEHTESVITACTQSELIPTVSNAQSSGGDNSDLRLTAAEVAALKHGADMLKALNLPDDELYDAAEDIRQRIVRRHAR